MGIRDTRTGDLQPTCRLLSGLERPDAEASVGFGSERHDIVRADRRHPEWDIERRYSTAGPSGLASCTAQSGGHAVRRKRPLGTTHGYLPVELQGTVWAGFGRPRPPAAFQHGPRGAATFIADGYGEVLSAWIPGLSVARRLGSDWNGSPSRRSVLREVNRARSFCRPLRNQQLAGTRRSGSYRRGVVHKGSERRTGDGFYPVFCPSGPI